MKLRGTPSYLLMLCLTGLAACSSKPDSADIQKELAQLYQCPLLGMSEVKKTDGAEGQGKQYEVAFTYTVSFKGSPEEAVRLYSEWSSLDAQVLPSQIANEHAIDDANRRLSAANNGNIPHEERDRDPDVIRTGMLRRQIVERMNAIVPCQGPEELTRLMQLRGEALDAAKASEQIAVPMGVKLKGIGVMLKTESGWHFNAMPMFNTEQIITGATVAYPHFEPLAAPAPVAKNAENDPPPAQLASVGATPSNPASDAAPLQGASFDCSKASTAVEKMICADPNLADVDASTAAAYKIGLAASVNPDGYKQGQANWRKNVRDACTDAACLSRVYQERLRELK